MAGILYVTITTDSALYQDCPIDMQLFTDEWSDEPVIVKANRDDVCLHVFIPGAISGKG
jgi:hypothetical protein